MYTHIHILLIAVEDVVVVGPSITKGELKKIKILKKNIAAVGTVLPEQCTWYGHQTTQHSVLFFIFLFSFFMHLRCGTLRCGSVLPERAAMQRKRATSSH